MFHCTFGDDWDVNYDALARPLGPQNGRRLSALCERRHPRRRLGPRQKVPANRSGRRRRRHRQPADSRDAAIQLRVRSPTQERTAGAQHGRAHARLLRFAGPRRCKPSAARRFGDQGLADGSDRAHRAERPGDRPRRAGPRSAPRRKGRLARPRFAGRRAAGPPAAHRRFDQQSVERLHVARRRGRRSASSPAFPSAIRKSVSNLLDALGNDLQNERPAPQRPAHRRRRQHKPATSPTASIAAPTATKARTSGSRKFPTTATTASSCECSAPQSAEGRTDAERELASRTIYLAVVPPLADAAARRIRLDAARRRRAAVVPGPEPAAAASGHQLGQNARLVRRQRSRAAPTN